MTNPARNLAFIRNTGAIPFADVPVVSLGEWIGVVTGELTAGLAISALFAAEAGQRHQLFAVLSNPETHEIGIVSTMVTGSYPTLTTEFPAAHWFEREIFEQHRIEPEGHPWLKPIRFQKPAVEGRYVPTVGVTDFFSMTGDEVHEVGVGPVHAGVIEPGHFRFSCHGETVYHLEISLGYQHRGIERALTGGPDARTIHYVETAAGDTSIGHTRTYCRAVESLAGIEPSHHARAVRAVAIELERMANHCGDLGALAGDVGFLPTQNYCSRIRGDILNMTALVCGNRFGRNLVVPGGVRHVIEASRCKMLLERLNDIERDLQTSVPLMFDTPSVMTRMDGIGIVTAELARRIGLVGPAARASGLNRDVRADFPYGAWDDLQFKVLTCGSGDCAARAKVRWMELQQSMELIRFLLAEIEHKSTTQSDGGNINGRGEDGQVHMRPDVMTVSMTEGWRGEICHVTATDADGRFRFYKIVDPSFHNWFGLAMALRNQQISDFPLCNKSFNLSYCGHDL